MDTQTDYPPAKLAFIICAKAKEAYKAIHPKLARSKAKMILAAYSDPAGTKLYARIDRGVMRLMADKKWATRFGIPEDYRVDQFKAYCAELMNAAIIAAIGKGMNPAYAALETPEGLDVISKLHADA